jgi:hypothetical protein
MDLVLLAVVMSGGVLAWRTGNERARLEAQHRRLVAAAGDLPVEDPTLIYLKALDTGDPLHFAWRVHLPANANLKLQSRSVNGWSGGSWSGSAPMDFIARVRFREDEQGMVNVYTRYVGSSSRSSIGSPMLARLLRDHARELKVEQAGTSGVATLDPNMKKPMVLLRLALPESLHDELPSDLPSPFLPNLMELSIGPPGSLP